MRILSLILVLLCSTVCKAENIKSCDATCKTQVDTIAPTLQEIKCQALETYINFCAQLNKQLPIYIDEITTLNSVAFIDWTFSSLYQVAIDVDDYEEEEMQTAMAQMKIAQKEQVSNMLMKVNYGFTQAELVEYLKMLGMQFKSTYMDINHKMIGQVRLTFADFE